MKTILVGYDGTRSAEHALKRTAELARAFDSKVIVVSVATPEPAAVPGAFGLMPYDYTTYAPDAPGNVLWEQHRKRVEGFFAGRKVPVEFTGVVGTAAHELVDQAERHAADLIVVGTREAGFVERLLGGGSVSQGVARHAHCDVLIVHPEHEDEAQAASSSTS